MVGYAEAKGLIPLTCSKLFDDASQMMSSDPNLRITVEVSYIEIYNEKVRDLLNPKNKGNLRVREHPSLGPYVEDLSKLVVKDFNDIEHLMDEGNKARTVAATNMNETSSRSHAVFTLVLTQKRKDEQTNLEAEKVSRISLVDLAGSERANSTGATGSRLKEGANINRSLTTLGKVIAALAQASMEIPKGKKKQALENFVPYRDSVLTWLLKDSLGGNSKTAMIAAISPADYEETLSTLRYADQAKKIKNKAVVNEDPNAKLIRELKEELEMLRNRVSLGNGVDGEAEGAWDASVPPEKQVVRYKTKSGEIKSVTKAELQDQLEQSEKLMESLNQSWEQKVAQTQAIQVEREKALEELGITVDKGNVGVHTPKSLPHLVNLNEDPLMSECLIYQLKPGTTLVGNTDQGESTEGSAKIRLSGSSILHEHCTFENVDGVVTVHCKTESMTMVNGKRVTDEQPRRLKSGYRVILGEDFRHVFRFNHPEEVRKERDMKRLVEHGGDLNDSDYARPDSPVYEPHEGNVDWTYARREAALTAVHGQNVDFDALSEDDLEKLYEDITRARSKKVGASWRPDSRLSSFDDNTSETASSELRPYSLSAYTDDTSLDPWNAHLDTPVLRDAPETPDSEQETQETLDLRKQVKDYEEQIEKLASQNHVNGLDLPISYTPYQKELIRKTLTQWKKRTNVAMAEVILSNAVLLKEANVISRELRKFTTYQFCIVDAGTLANPVSHVDSIAGLSEFEDVADTQLSQALKPCVAVRVLDHQHQSTYVWSIAKLEQRLQKMQNLYTFIDRPEYSQHFNWADPFYNDNVSSFTFIGTALLPLTTLYRQVSAKYEDVPVFSRHTCKQIATCRAELNFVSMTARSTGKGDISGNSLSLSFNNQNTGELSAGQKLACQISVDTFLGLQSQSFEQMHLQVQLASMAEGMSSEVITTVPTDREKDLKLRKTVSFLLDENNIKHLRDGFLPIEVFAKVDKSYLKSLENFDASCEKDRYLGRAPIVSQEHDNPDRPSLHAKSSSSGRLSEKEMVSEERHDVLMSVQLLELDASGEYKPVPVRSQSLLDPGAFFLRQGLQRKIAIQMRHDSGRQFPWSKVARIRVGQIRLLDSKGKVHVSTFNESIDLKVPAKQQTLGFHGNGTSDLDAWAWWDSSVHDSIFLNRHTASNHRVLLSLAVEITVENCSEPVLFEMDFAVIIHSRDSKPPNKIMSMLESATSGTRTLTRTSNVFAVRLMPSMTKKSKELWRLDTATKYVRGQETLDGLWKPRSVRLVHQHAGFIKRERREAEVRGIRALLNANPPLSLQSGHDVDIVSHKEGLLRQAVDTWLSVYADSKVSVLANELMENRQAHSDSAPWSGFRQDQFTDESKGSVSPVDGVREQKKLNATVTLMPRTDTASKRGFLSMPIEAFTDHWARRWFVLRRPYLYIYESSSELDEILAVYLGTVRVEHDVNIEQMLGVSRKSSLSRKILITLSIYQRQDVFGLYTAANSYFLQAPSTQEMEHWMNSLSIRR